MKTKAVPTTFINPFVDFAFKRLFTTDESKPILIGLLNQLLEGRECITAIQFNKNEHQGDHYGEGGAVFDVCCTDADGRNFIIEVQSGYQKFFKDRALFYTSRFISGKALKGSRKEWGYQLPEVYLS